MKEIAEEIVSLIEREEITGATKIVTAEASGIAPAFCVASLLDIPLLYARKGHPLTMQNERISIEVSSRTKNQTTTLSLSKEFLKESDRVIIIDDFLGSGGALEALTILIKETGAEVLCAAFVVEKTYEKARSKLSHLHFPILSLVKAHIEEENLSFSI